MTIGYPLDLHVHSVYSDGLMTPAQLCAQAGKRGLRAVALCDHDTLSGLGPMAKAVEEHNRQDPDSPLAFLPAIELSTGPGGRTHILGYGADPNHAGLQARLAEWVQDRKQRAERILDKLRAQGVTLTQQALEGLDCPTVGRAHIARAMIASGVVNTVAQAFDRYLAEGKSCYVPRKVVNAAQGVALLRTAGAVPVLAHPLRLNLEEQAIYMLVGELVEAGLMGIEAYHPSATRRAAASLDAFARRSGLLVTGGSDYHGDREARVQLGHMPAGWNTWQEDYQALLLAVGTK